MLDKPFEYWAALAGMVLYAAAKDAEREPIIRRVAKVSASALLAFGVSPSLAPYLHDSETMAAVCIMAFGQLFLDVVTATLGNREFVQKLIMARFGGGRDGDA